MKILFLLLVSSFVVTDVNAIETGTANQVLRYPSSAPAGTRPKYGAVNLASASAVTGVLPLANITNGTTGQYLQAGASNPAYITGYILSTITTFAASGTWTKPAGCRAVMVEIVGGGGGGGGATNVGSGASAGGGGGAGGYCRRFVTSPGATETVTIGALGGGGTGGATGGAGSAGGNSSFGSWCTANGGSAGSAGTPKNTGVAAGAIANGGTAASGDINLPGGTGYSGTILGSIPASYGGTGGNSYFGQGGYSGYSGGSGGTPPAGAYGAGGGGGAENSASGRAGGNGVIGVAFVYEYY